MNRIMLLLLVLVLCVVAVVFTLFIGWLMDDDRHNQRKLDDDTDTRLYVPSRCRNRSGNNGYDQQVDVREVINGLQKLRKGLSEQERIWLDYSCDCVIRIAKLQEMIQSGKENGNDDNN